MITIQNDEKMMRNTVDSRPGPNMMTASGISATDGIGRRNSMVDAVASRSTAIDPMKIPSTMPATRAMDNPVAHVRSVSASACQKTGVCSRSSSAGTISENGGRKRGLTSPTLGRISASATRPSTPTAPRRTRCSPTGRRRRGRAVLVGMPRAEAEMPMAELVTVRYFALTMRSDTSSSESMTP